MATSVNSSSQYQAAVRRQLAKEVLPIVQRSLVAYQFAEKKRMEKGAGVTWTATRFNRLPLPFAPLSEGVPPIGETLQISQVTGVALQWGDKVTLTDVSVITTLYDLVQQAKRLLGVQIKELHERNTYSALMAGQQINYVNNRGSRASLVAGDVMDTVTLNRTYADLENTGAPFYNGQLEPDIERDIGHGPAQASKTPMAAEHYVAIMSPLVEQDLRQNSTIVNAWSYSDVGKLYINEVGYWAGIHFTKSNMLPRFTGVASPTNGTPGSAGALATGTYYIQITGTDQLNQFGEQLIYQVSAGASVTGPTGSLSVTVPSTAGYTYSVYIGTTSSPTQIGTSSTSGVGIPTTGPAAGQCTQIQPGATVIINGLGLFAVPPAAPATGVTVYPTFVFGAQYFACTILEDVSYTFLGDADKSDPLNQLRVVGYKFFEGVLILNQQFGARIESSVSNAGVYG
jgi:N4-gp56 family major capsid protein